MNYKTIIFLNINFKMRKLYTDLRGRSFHLILMLLTMCSIQLSSQVDADYDFSGELRFKREMVSDKFDQFSIETDKQVVILRNDRLEFFQKDLDFDDSYFYMLPFEKGGSTIEGVNLIEKKTILNKNAAMAEVLGDPNISYEYYDSVRYIGNNGQEYLVEIIGDNITISSTDSTFSYDENNWRFITTYTQLEKGVVNNERGGESTKISKPSANRSNGQVINLSFQVK